MKVLEISTPALPLVRTYNATHIKKPTIAVQRKLMAPESSIMQAQTYGYTKLKTIPIPKLMLNSAVRASRGNANSLMRQGICKNMHHLLMVDLLL